MLTINILYNTNFISKNLKIFIVVMYVFCLIDQFYCNYNALFLIVYHVFKLFMEL